MVCDCYAALDHRLFKITSMLKEAACGPSHPCRVTTPVSHLTELHAAAWTNFLIAECGGGLLWPWLGQRHPLKWNRNHTFLSRYGNPRGWQRLIWTHWCFEDTHTLIPLPKVGVWPEMNTCCYWQSLSFSPFFALCQFSFADCHTTQCG